MTLTDNQVLLVKFVLVFIILALYILRSLISKYWQSKDNQSIDGISDPLFKLSNRMNIYFRTPEHRNYVVAIISCALDCMFCVQLYKFARYGNSWRFPIALGLFYGLRAYFQSTIIFERPEGAVWTYPGWFTTFVPFPLQCDYWWSGHIGFCFVNYNEFKKNGENSWAIYSFVLMIFTTFFLIVLRAHYSVDITTGFAIGHFLWILVDKYIFVFDYYVLGIPLSKRIGTYQ